MVKVQNFHEGLEQGLERLTANIQSTKEKPEARDWSEREIVKQSVRSLASGVQTPAPSQPVGKDEQKKQSFLPGYLDGDSAAPQVKSEVERLINLALHENLEKALKESKRHPAFVQDAFHDALADKLLPELKRRKMI